MRYYDVDDQYDSTFRNNRRHDKGRLEPGTCTYCSKRLHHAGPPEILEIVDIDKPKGRKPLFSFTTPWNYGVIHCDLLEVFGKEGQEHLLLGKMKMASGKMIEDYRTFCGVEDLQLRGTMESYHKLCKVCGRLLITVPYWDKPYLTTAQVKSRRPIYGSHETGLIVNQEILDRIDLKMRKALRIRELPVLDEPLDGLPADANWFLTPEQLKDYKPRLGPWEGGQLPARD